MGGLKKNSQGIQSQNVFRAQLRTKNSTYISFRFGNKRTDMRPKGA